MTIVSIQIPADIDLPDLASRAATVAELAGKHRSVLLGLAEMLRKAEGELSNQGVRGLADLLGQLDLNLELAVDELKVLAGCLEYVAAPERDKPQLRLLERRKPGEGPGA